MSSIKPVFKCVEGHKDIFKNSQCLLLISIGQEAHEGDRFEATIDLVNSSFSSCIISLYDSIQRHTMSLNSLDEPEKFHQIAINEGDLWLKRNEKYFKKLTILKYITRWNSWLHHPNYIIQKNTILELINTNPLFKSVFDETVETYLARYCKRLSNIKEFNLHRAKTICFDYLVEECAVLCLWPELKCQFELYPNYHNAAIEETRKVLLSPKHPELMRPIRIGFRNAKQVKPQKFELLED